MLWEQGMNTANLVYLLRSILAERQSQQTQRDSIDLVWTGDEILGASGRDTRVVVQELFRTAQRSVLISTYAIDKGENAAILFGGLAAKMDKDFQLQVRLFLNIKREFQRHYPNGYFSQGICPPLSRQKSGQESDFPIYFTTRDR